MEEETPTCPECGYPLTGKFLKNRGKMTISFFCDQGGEDIFRFQILTGISDRDIANLVVGKPLRKEVTVKLLKRKSEEEAIKSYDIERKEADDDDCEPHV